MKNKVYIPEKRVGIWLDHEHAHIFQMNKDFLYVMNTLDSDSDNKDELNGGKKYRDLKECLLTARKGNDVSMNICLGSLKKSLNR